MSSLRTLFRAVIMISTLALVAKGWYLYGPSREQVASFAVRAVEVGDSLLGKFREPTPTPPAAVDPRTAPAPFVAAPAAAPAISQPAPHRLPPTTIAPLDEGAVVLASAAEPSSSAGQPAGGSALVAPLTRVSADTRLETALAQLEQLGVGQHRLEPWGARGQLYRFCCSAAWGGAPGYNRHFEVVAAEPLAAVEQVVDQITAWRAAGRDTAELR